MSRPNLIPEPLDAAQQITLAFREIPRVQGSVT